jgi:hypothetical protein
MTHDDWRERAWADGPRPLSGPGTPLSVEM